MSGSACETSAKREVLCVPAQLIARAVLALVTLPLLYRALGEPGEGWGGSQRSVARRLFFSVLGALVFFSITERWVPARAGPSMGDAFQAYSQGMTYFRLSFTNLGRIPGGRGGLPPGDAALKDLERAAALLPESAQFHRMLGIARAHRGDYPGAWKALQKAAAMPKGRAPEKAAEERRLWESLFGPTPPTAAELRSARARLERQRLGWMGKVALLAAYRRQGPRAAPEDLEREVRREAESYALRLFVSGFGMAFLLPQLGLISLVVGAVLVSTHVLRRAPPHLHPVGAVLWESLILMFVFGMAPGLLSFGGKRPGPETNPGLIGAMMLAADVAQCFAVGYLWWRLRSRGLSLAEIGLSLRHFWSNVLVGIMAATVLTPFAVLVGLATQALSDRLFPNMAPPYHPLQGYTATYMSEEIRLALFLAAAVGAPLLEEIFFRGVLYGALRRRFGIAAGMMGSATFFAILHPQLPLGFLPIAFLGAAFAALYEWRQSLIPGIVAHALNNGLIFLMLTFMFPIRG